MRISIPWWLHLVNWLASVLLKAGSALDEWERRTRSRRLWGRYTTSTGLFSAQEWNEEID